MFGGLFRRKPPPTIAFQPIGEIFPWPAGATLKPLDRLTLALPTAMLEPDESIGSVVDADDDAEIAIPDGDDKLYVRLLPGMSIKLTRSVQALILPYADGESGSKRIEVVPPSDAGT